MGTFTTEITSDTIPSDNPIHQRLLQAYYLALPYIQGDTLELGCGEGRGVELIYDKANSYTAVDKIGEILEPLKEKYPKAKFIQSNMPPLENLEDNQFDTVVSFQVIEHIKNDLLFLEEIHRVLKKGGTALLTTPNIKKSLTRNPWHIREYTAKELTRLASSIFPHVEMKGISGNEKVMEYYERNKSSVERITRFDILKLQYRLPAPLLRVPYDIMNRMNRNKLKNQSDDLVLSIRHDDYIPSDDADTSLDLLLIVTK